MLSVVPPGLLRLVIVHIGCTPFDCRAVGSLPYSHAWPTVGTSSPFTCIVLAIRGRSCKQRKSFAVT
jgi:hypothetical protein